MCVEPSQNFVFYVHAFIPFQRLIWHSLHLKCILCESVERKHGPHSLQLWKNIHKKAAAARMGSGANCSKKKVVWVRPEVPGRPPASEEIVGQRSGRSIWAKPHQVRKKSKPRMETQRPPVARPSAAVSLELIASKAHAQTFLRLQAGGSWRFFSVMKPRFI